MRGDIGFFIGIIGYSLFIGAIWLLACLICRLCKEVSD